MELMTWKEVMARVRLSRGALYNNINRGEFPKPAKLGKRSMFDRQEIEAWLTAQFAARYPKGDPRAPKQDAT